MLIRHAAIAVTAIVAIPFVVSSPTHEAFWITLTAVTFVMLPWVGVVAWFHTDIRRMLRERKRLADPS
jgi:threonine/homoserine/homoserine lactone efflux protein